MSVHGIYGLSGSGIDVESMVKAGMLSKQSEYDKMYKKEVKNTWLKSEYADFYSSMYTFKYTTMSNYKMQSTMNAMTASSSDSTTVSATANGAAASMSHKVAVTSLASSAYLLSTGSITRANTTSSSSIYLKDVLFSSFAANANATYTYNDTTYDKSQVTTNADGTYTIKSADGNTTIAENIAASSVTANSTYTVGSDTTGHAAKDIAMSFTIGNAAETFTYNNETYAASQVTYDSASKTYTIKSTDGKTTIAENIAEKDVVDNNKPATISYTYEDLANGKTLNDLASDVNSAGLDIVAKYDATSDAFSLYNSNGGKANTIELTATDANGVTLLNNLKLGSSTGTTLSAAKTFALNATDETAGINGNVTIDGKTYSDLTSNKYTVAGVTYTFNNTTATGATTTVSVSQDTDSIISSVKQFVEDYNKMLDSLNDKYYETQYSDYQPLTKSQESAMTSTQISDWNAKAKSGLLYHSSLIRTIVSDMREAIYTPVDSVDSKYNSASAIGITTSNNKGHLTLDEDKLKEALAADPDSVYQIFASNQDNSTTSTSQGATSFKVASNFRNTGLANRLYNVMTTSMTSISKYAGTSEETNDQSYLGTLITNLQTKMSNFKTQMDAYEDLLYKKYDAMETAIATLSSQLSSVTGSNS